MKLEKRLWGTLPEGDVHLYTLEGGAGVRAAISDLGGTVRSLFVPDRNGVPADIVLGYDTPEEYLANGCFFGATIGRYANRIKGARIRIEDHTYRLTANEGKNTLHGGSGFHTKLWRATETPDWLYLSYVSPDREDGFPGETYVTVRFGFNDDGNFEIGYSATANAPTFVSLTNHAYFNLAGKGTALGHRLRLGADFYTPADGEGIPTGEILPVEGTALDFREARPVESDYDNNFVLNKEGPAAELFEETSGRLLRLRTDLPGLQLYSGWHIPQGQRGKDGAVYGPHSGLCLEPQFFPDSPHRPEFPSALLSPDGWYERKIVWEFSVE
ncbi:MAG TPA: aldose epimerase family protein [Oscillospiraceae bacterium]|nr:galactose mutarotase [Oscillospiraceae bacterium]HNW04695.1 aldose epimerase family protein [Oscillospiraceae bacterium]HPV99429.1 aldose epimerase family protein [Oscillospiraceae bacterium]